MTPHPLSWRWWAPVRHGTDKRHRLEENLGAATLKLTPDDLWEINEAAAELTVTGDRYPAHLQSRVGR